MELPAYKALETCVAPEGQQEQEDMNVSSWPRAGVLLMFQSESSFAHGNGEVLLNN